MSDSGSSDSEDSSSKPQQDSPGKKEHLKINMMKSDGSDKGHFGGGAGLNRHWFELRLKGKLPERRGNHASFIFDGK